LKKIQIQKLPRHLQTLTVGQIRIEPRREKGPGDRGHGRGGGGDGGGLFALGVRRRRAGGDQMERRVPLVGRHRTDRRAVRQQEVRGVRVAPLHGQVQQRVPVTVARVRVRLVLAQHLRDAGLMVAQRQVQGRLALVVQLVDFRVQLPTTQTNRFL